MMGGWFSRLPPVCRVYWSRSRERCAACFRDRSGSVDFSEIWNSSSTLFRCVDNLTLLNRKVTGTADGWQYAALHRFWITLTSRTPAQKTVRPSGGPFSLTSLTLPRTGI